MIIMLKDYLQKERKRKEEDRMVERKENRVKKGRNEWRKEVMKNCPVCFTSPNYLVNFRVPPST